MSTEALRALRVNLEALPRRAELSQTELADSLTVGQAIGLISSTEATLTTGSQKPPSEIGRAVERGSHTLLQRGTSCSLARFFRFPH